MATILRLLRGFASAATLALHGALRVGALGARAAEGYIYAAKAFSAMVAALNARFDREGTTKRGISPAVTNGESA
jgi:hypothetical protein